MLFEIFLWKMSIFTKVKSEVGQGVFVLDKEKNTIVGRFKLVCKEKRPCL